VDHAAVLLGLRRLQGSLKVIHGWPVSKKHAEHLAPQAERLDLLVQLDSCPRPPRLRRLHGLAEIPCRTCRAARARRWGEQRPVAVGLNAFQEQIGDPVRGVMSWVAAAVVAGVLAQVEELLDVEVPGFQVAQIAPLRLPPC